MPDVVVAVDVGGTFTDLAAYDTETGRLIVHKLLTTSHDPTEGIARGIQELCASGDIQSGSLTRLIHGTTLITNALIERKGHPTGLLTTSGFRDVLEIGNELRYNIYDLELDRPEPLAARWARRAVKERISGDGSIIVPLDEESLLEQADYLYASGIRTVAIAFFNSYASSRHERLARDLVTERFPHMEVCISSDVSSEIREFERVSTTTANAYVKILAGQYLGRLAEVVNDLGATCPIYLVLSDGGLTHIDTGVKFPIQLCESGPAAGVMMAAHVGSDINEPSVVSFDMGGTTAKLALIEGGRVEHTHEFEAGRTRRFEKGSGFPLRIPSVDLVEIGAGGGSIAWRDTMGLLKVGPESAGSNPGPACYGLGGVLPTVTDADLVLGYLNPDYFLGGRMRLDVEAAGAAVYDLGRQFGLNDVEIAAGIHKVVNNNMATAARVHLAEKGVDPRTHSMIAFGGAAPLHAYGVARQLHIPKVIFPPGSGVASALGMLVSTPTSEWTRSLIVKIESLPWKIVEDLLDELVSDANSFLEEIGERNPRIEFSADMRYVGQAHEVTVKFSLEAVAPHDPQYLKDLFQDAYLARYGRILSNVPIEALTWRVRAYGHKPPVSLRYPAEQNLEGGLKGERRAHFPLENKTTLVPIYDRYAIMPGIRVEGPVILEEPESTIVVGPWASVMVDDSLNVVMDLSRR